MLDLLARDNWELEGFIRVLSGRPIVKPNCHRQGDKATGTTLSTVDLAFKGNGREWRSDRYILLPPWSSHPLFSAFRTFPHLQVLLIWSPFECPLHPLCLNTDYLPFKVQSESQLLGMSYRSTAHCSNSSDSQFYVLYMWDCLIS